jgi:UDP-glucose 4-epimerase
MTEHKGRLLITGGCGYIGSHAVVEAINFGYEITVLDNLVNSSQIVLDRISSITGKKISFINADVRDGSALQSLFQKSKYDAVMHFAGIKAVGESVEKPLDYYDNNVSGSLTLLRAMREAGITKFIFSSSATVYGSPEAGSVPESAPLGSVTNPYGRSKLMVEDILRDLAASDPAWSIAILRYFNPIGAHPSGLIGEDPRGIPNNLLPFVTQVAIGRRKKLSIYGNDYDTPDGTGIRDYLHVVDLAKGHLAALKHIQNSAGAHIWNLGTGRGYSVLEIIQAFEQATGTSIPYEFVDRRAGDISQMWADPEKAAAELKWRTELDIFQMMRDAWNWQKNNPHGFVEPEECVD